MSLEGIRRKIDLTDKEILKLLNKRTSLILSIAKIKKKKDLPIYTPSREKEVYEKLKALNKGPIEDKSLKAIYREIMSSALNLEKPMKVTYLGPKATFTQMAAIQKFGESVDYIECKSISDVFTEVERGRADYGVVPIENSIEGAVNHTLDMFIESELRICSEIYLPIRHHLLSKHKKL
ncbi:MAG: chorismate mutase, partial [Candidatus Omnitrophica bacterium]|nr:chorismate mutase [Candidatus Omnitrophota bacterium]